VQHGIIDVAVEGEWKTRQARQYRLTFVSTKLKPATNEYRSWTPDKVSSRVTGAVTEGHGTATTSVAALSKAVTGAVAVHIEQPRKSGNSHPRVPATRVVALIDKPCDTPIEKQGSDSNKSSDSATSGKCERCAKPFETPRQKRANRRFCTEYCRKAAETARAYRRRKLEPA
jgi:hypothetical protein